MSLLTPHKLMRNCSVVLRLLLHLSLHIKAFQAFSISGPGRSSPYSRRVHMYTVSLKLHLAQISKPYFITFQRSIFTFAVMNMRLLSTIDVACKEPQPVPFNWVDEPVLGVRLEASQSEMLGVKDGSNRPLSTNSMFPSQGRR